MWIERLEIPGFRRLAGSFVFAEGLTLVVGANESGKSSLHEALVRALYGFSPGEVRRSGGLSAKDRRRPWDSGRPYGLVATVHQKDGRSFRVEWDFEAHTVSVYDAITGKPVLTEAPGQSLLHLGLDDFRQVCCLTQDQIVAVAGSETLKNALEEAIMSAGGGVRADEADGRMKAFLQRLGIRVDTYKATAAGRLRGLETTRDELGATLAEAEAEQERIAALAQELAVERERSEGLVAHESALRQGLFRDEAETLEARLEKARRHIASAAARPTHPVVLPASVVRPSADREAALDALAGPIARYEKQVEKESAQVEALEGEEHELKAIVDGLSSYSETDARSEADVRARWAELGALPKPVAGAVPSEPVLIELPAPSFWDRVKQVLWLALVVLTLGLAALVRRWLRQRRLRFTQQAVESALEHQREATLIRRRDLEREILEALDAVGILPTGDLAQRVGAYLAACEKHAEWVAKRLLLEQTTAKLRSAKEPARFLRERREERDALREELLGLYEKLGVSGLGFEKARASAVERRAQAARDAATLSAADAAQQALEAALAGKTIGSLEAAATKSRRAYEEHVAAHGPLPPPKKGMGIDDVRDKAKIARDRIVKLETQIGAREQALPEPAELKEELDACTADIARIEQAARAVRVARETLAEAATETYKQFAPHLNAALEVNLPRITDGRYRSATVDDNLDIHVVAPETGTQVSVEDLSRATKDQIFLIQRLEIARLLDPTTGSAPLLLDDPFAHFDDTRLRLGLEVIRDVAAQRQVILFSEEASLIELAQSVCGACVVVELPAPSERAA